MGSNPTSTANSQPADLRFRLWNKINKGEWSRKWSRNAFEDAPATVAGVLSLVVGCLRAARLSSGS